MHGNIKCEIRFLAIIGIRKRLVLQEAGEDLAIPRVNAPLGSKVCRMCVVAVDRADSVVYTICSVLKPWLASFGTPSPVQAMLPLACTLRDRE